MQTCRHKNLAFVPMARVSYKQRKGKGREGETIQSKQTRGESAPGAAEAIAAAEAEGSRLVDPPAFSVRRLASRSRLCARPSLSVSPLHGSLSFALARSRSRSRSLCLWLGLVFRSACGGVSYPSPVESRGGFSVVRSKQRRFDDGGADHTLPHVPSFFPFLPFLSSLPFPSLPVFAPLPARRLLPRLMPRSLLRFLPCFLLRLLLRFERPFSSPFFR